MEDLLENPEDIMKQFKSYLFLLLFISLASCKKDPSANADTELGYDYFPVEVGNYSVYDVDSIVYNDFTGEIDTFNYQLKEVIESDFVDNGGRVSQRIERYNRDNDSAEWHIQDVWQATRTTNRAERVEENVKYIRLMFPVREGLKWDGNAYNTDEEWKYVYQNAHKADLINGISFDSTVTVLQRDEFNLIEVQYYEERYAKDVGLIYKKVDDLKTEINGTIKSGVKYTFKIREFGKT